MRNLAPAHPCPAPTQALAEQALVPVSDRVAELLKPVHSFPKYGSHGYEGDLEIWQPKSVTFDDLPDLGRQLTIIEAALNPGEPGSTLARIHGLLAMYRDTNPLPLAVEESIAEAWLDDLGQFPSWVIAEACRRWRRHPTKYRYKPLPGDILSLCKEIVGMLPIYRDRLKALLVSVPKGGQPTTPPTHGDGIRARVIALAAAKRIPS